jgi:hypothetical protein
MRRVSQHGATARKTLVNATRSSADVKRYRGAYEGGMAPENVPFGVFDGPMLSSQRGKGLDGSMSHADEGMPWYTSTCLSCYRVS